MPHNHFVCFIRIWSLFWCTCFLLILSLFSLYYFKVCKFIIRKLGPLNDDLLAFLTRNLCIIEYFFAFYFIFHRCKFKLTLDFLISVWTAKAFLFSITNWSLICLIHLNFLYIFQWFQRFPQVYTIKTLNLFHFLHYWLLSLFWILKFQLRENFFFELKNLLAYSFSFFYSSI